MLADAGLVISAGKMSGRWSGCPASIQLDDLDVLCVVSDRPQSQAAVAKEPGPGRRSTEIFSSGCIRLADLYRPMARKVALSDRSIT
jgi:hypothetical protein